jgi:twitching motility protein PilU
MAMDRLFQLMKDKKASDLFLTVNSPIHIKISGFVLPINQQKMDVATIKSLLAEVTSPAQLEELAERHELNLGIPVAGLGSFRLSAFRQRGTISAVFRYIPGDIPRLADLNVPPILADIIME